LPKLEPWQVKPEDPPQDPSVETAVELEPELDVVVEVDAGAELVEVTTLPLELRYQLASGSPRHWPTVPNVQPCCLAYVIMNWVRLWAVCSWMSWPMTSQLSVAGLELDRLLVKMFLDVWIWVGESFRLSCVSRSKYVIWYPRVPRSDSHPEPEVHDEYGGRI
jgi:hypothetical protein